MSANILNTIKHPLILYDGYCHLCTATVKFLIQTDRKKKLRFTPLQSKMAAKLSKDTQIKLMKSKGVGLYYKNSFWFKSEAIFKTFRILGGGYSILAVFSLLPLKFSNRIYDFIAANRYKWFGERQNLHRQESNSDRFILHPDEID